jgi:hypothetical protein
MPAPSVDGLGTEGGLTLVGGVVARDPAAALTMTRPDIAGWIVQV